MTIKTINLATDTFKKAAKEDLREILDLQYIAYQSEADLFGT